MIGALVIVFREVIEAGLIVGIVLAVTRGLPGRALWVGGGLAAGLLGAALVAVFAGALSDAFEGAGQEVLNAGVLGFAALMLAWHNVWMARHGREMAAQLNLVGREVAEGRKSLFALAVVIAVAVLREGSEVALFLYGLVAGGGTDGKSLFFGGLLGLVAGGCLSAAMFYGLVAIPMRHLFAATSALIGFLAAGMAAQSVAFLQQADLIALGRRQVWDSSGLLAEDSLAGRIAHTLIGYTDRPSALQLAVYLLALLAIFGLTKSLRPARAKPAPGRVAAR